MQLQIDLFNESSNDLELICHVKGRKPKKYHEPADRTITDVSQADDQSDSQHDGSDIKNQTSVSTLERQLKDANNHIALLVQELDQSRNMVSNMIHDVQVSNSKTISVEEKHSKMESQEEAAEVAAAA